MYRRRDTSASVRRHELFDPGAVGAGIHALAARPVWPVVAWSIPGVLLGSTIGSQVGKYMPAKLMEKALGVVFVPVGLLVLGLEVLG